MSLPIAFRLVEPVLFPLGNRLWPLLITYGALLDCERETGEDMLGSVAALVSPSCLVLRVLLWSTLRSVGSEWTVEDVGARMHRFDLPRIEEALLKAFVRSMPAPPKAARRDRKNEPPKQPRCRNWPELWSEARIELKLDDEEFLGLTPGLLQSLRDAQVGAWQREELMFSRLTARMMNHSYLRPKETVKDDYFMLHPFPEQPLTAEVMIAKMKAAGIKKKE